MNTSHTTESVESARSHVESKSAMSGVTFCIAVAAAIVVWTFPFSSNITSVVVMNWVDRFVSALSFHLRI